MELTIGYHLRFKGSNEQARSVMCALHQTALDLPFKWVSDLKELHGPACGVDAHPAEDPTRLLVACLGKAVPFITAEGAKEGLHVDLSSHPVGPEAVIGFYTIPGDGCEEAGFGLSRYPEFAETPHGRMRTGLRGWYWHEFCKTQYASNPTFGGVPNFLRCHLGIVALLDKAKSLTCQVHVNDEGEFWQTRDLKRLLKALSDYNGLVASIVGRLADETELKAPIRDYPDFEHWEALGENVGSLRSLVDQVRTGPGRTGTDGASSEPFKSGSSRDGEPVGAAGGEKRPCHELAALKNKHERGGSAAKTHQTQAGVGITQRPSFKDKQEGAQCLITALREYLPEPELLEILHRGADPLYRDNRREESPLEIAARSCHPDQVEPILRHLKARGFDFRHSSRLALALTRAAVEACNRPMVDLLLNYETNPNLPHGELYSPLVQVMLKHEELLESNPVESELEEDEEFDEENRPELFECLGETMVEAGGDRQRALNTILSIEACRLERESAKAWCSKGADPSEALRYTIRAHPRASGEAAELLVTLGADVHCVTEGDLLALLRPQDSPFCWSKLGLARWLFERGSAPLVPREMMDFILAMPPGDRTLVWDWEHATVTRFIARRSPAVRQCIQAWRETISM